MENLISMGKWRFTSNHNAGETGINDAGIETFSKDFTNSLVRESIQNSLDAKDESINSPVEVHFNLFETNVSTLPGYEDLRAAIDKCCLSSKGDKTANDFFRKASEIIKKDKITILRISDYNTVGLQGSETPRDRTSNWYGLVKKEGSSNNKN